MNWNDVLEYSTKGSPTPQRRVEKTEQQWKDQLPPEQYRINRLKGTERAFSGEHCNTYDEGKYECICCEEPLFDSSIKFDSSSGWPSFTEPITQNAIKYEMDKSFGMTRIEVMCNVCDSHLGHVFPDGPAPSGIRFCINNESIK